MLYISNNGSSSNDGNDSDDNGNDGYNYDNTTKVMILVYYDDSNDD
jgi:hypothetical protein